MNNNSDRFYVVTGGPGSGKTSTIEALRQRGYTCPPEAGRGVIQDQVRIEGLALPWSDPLLFAELMLSWDMRSYHEAATSAGPVFFDRGIPDVLGYLRLLGIAPPPHVHNAALAFRYSPKVFVTPPWIEIYRYDRERKQDFEEAVRTYESLVATYADLKYELLEIPRVSIEDRVAFVLEHILGQNPTK